MSERETGAGRDELLRRRAALWAKVQALRPGVRGPALRVIEGIDRRLAEADGRRDAAPTPHPE